MQCYASVKTSTQLYNVHRLSNKVNYMLWAIVFILAVVFIIWDLPESNNKPCQGMHTLWSVQVCRPLSLSIYISTCFFSNQMKSTQCYNHGFSYIHNSKRRPFIRKELEWTSCWVGLEIICPTVKDNKLIHSNCFHFLFSFMSSWLWIICLYAGL